MLRICANWVIATALLLLFNQFNWITVLQDGEHVHTLSWSVIGSTMILAIVFALISWVVSLLYAISLLLIIPILLLPLLGWAVLAATEYMLPSHLQLHGFWLTLLCGWLLMWIRFGGKSTETQSQYR